MVPRLVLVHSPLIGSAAWEPVAADLAERGYQVAIPDLTGTVSGGPPYCVPQAEMIARGAAGQSAILIGHSGAGPLLATAGALIDHAAGYIFIDAGLPIPGQTWMQTVPPDLAAQARALGWPVKEQPSHHLALLTDPYPIAASLTDLISKLTR